MANGMSAENYMKTYSTFGGCDIVATFNGKVIGELQAITYSLTREKVPVYTMGSAEPRSFSRGKRGIAGNLVFVSFNRDALLSELGELKQISKYQANIPQGQGEFMSMEKWDEMMSNLANTGETGDNPRGIGNTANLVDKTKPVYADELLPFDITISLANEYGNKAVTVIYGVEILNEGIGFSIDAPTSERAYTFVARSVETMKPVDEDNLGVITTTW